MKLRLYVVSVLVLALLFVPRLWAQNIQADAVLKAREAALAAGNLDAILNLFADDAVVVTSSGRFFIGKEQVRGWVQDQVDRRQREEAGSRYISGNKLSWAGKVYREDWHKLGVSPLDVTRRRHHSGGQGSSSLTPRSPQSQQQGCRQPGRRTKGISDARIGIPGRTKRCSRRLTAYASLRLPGAAERQR